jgi:hypothetical protein
VAGVEFALIDEVEAGWLEGLHQFEAHLLFDRHVLFSSITRMGHCVAMSSRARSHVARFGNPFSGTIA